MKRINYLFGLMLGIGLFSCTDDEILDRGQNGNKTYQKIEATMEVKNAVIGIGGEAPATRGSQFVGNRYADKHANDSNDPQDFYGYLKYKYTPRKVNDLEITDEPTKYITEMNADLIVGMECDGQKAYFHLAGPKELIIKDDDTMATRPYLRLSKTGEGASFELTDPGQRQNDKDMPVIVADNYEQFVKKVRANKQGLKVYVSAIAGGNFICKDARNHYAPSQDFDPDRKYYRRSGTSVTETEHPFLSGMGEYASKIETEGHEHQGENTAKKRDAVPMDIPLTTQGWEQIGSKRVQLKSDGNWSIDLSDIEINLKPSGYLLALTFKNTATAYSKDLGYVNVWNGTPYEMPVDGEDQSIGLEAKPVESWINYITIRNAGDKKTMKIPMSTNVTMSSDWTGKEEVNDTDKSFIDCGPILLNGRYTGNIEADSYSRPIYFWAHGNGTLAFDFYLNQKTTCNIKDPNVVPMKEWWTYYLDKKQAEGGVNSFGYNYGLGGNHFSFSKDFYNMKEGKSYLCRFNDNLPVEEKEGEGLIMTEIFTPKDVTKPIPKQDYESWTMVELYNPTDYPIDLRKYGLIRFANYKAYQATGRKGGVDVEGRFERDFNTAKVLNIYVKQFYEFDGKDTKRQAIRVLNVSKQMVYQTDGDEESKATNMYRVWEGEYSYIIQPKKTIILLAGQWINKQAFLRDWELFDDKENNKWGRIPKELHDMIFKNYDEGYCQYIIGTDNAKSERKGRGGIGNTGTLNIGWMEGKRYCGLALVKLDENQNWKMVDVFGVTEQDDGLIKEYADAKGKDMQTAGEELYRKAMGEPFDKWRGIGRGNEERSISIIRNNRKGDDRQNIHFLKKNKDGDIVPVIGLNEKEDLWLIRPFSWSKTSIDNPANVPYKVSFGRRWWK